MVLKVQGLCVDIPAGNDTYLSLIDDISFKVHRGQTVAIVGESGCGKTVTARAVLNLLPPNMISLGDITFHNYPLGELSKRKWQEIRGDRISMIFQDPMSSLNPILRIGDQGIEFINCHRKVSKPEAIELIFRWFKRVGIREPERIFNSYPHQLSGGLCQRVIIAFGLMLEPDLIIADEPTTALDVTTQRKVMSLFFQLTKKRGTSVILISHDLAMVSQVADVIMVMYMGKIVEKIPCSKLFTHAKHPYTKALLSCHPRKFDPSEGRALKTIKGSVPDIKDMPEGCRFCGRCPVEAMECSNAEPPLAYLEDQHEVLCFHVEQEAT